MRGAAGGSRTRWPGWPRLDTVARPRVAERADRKTALTPSAGGKVLFSSRKSRNCDSVVGRSKMKTQLQKELLSTGDRVSPRLAP